MGWTNFPFHSGFPPSPYLGNWETTRVTSSGNSLSVYFLPPPPPRFKISVFWRKSKIPKNSNWIFKKTTSRNISMGILRHEVQGRGEDTELAS